MRHIRSSIASVLTPRILSAIICAALSLIIVAGDAHGLDFSVHGYYRNRIVVNDDLDLQKPGAPYSNDRFGLITYNQMRLRLQPNLKLGEFLAMHATFDVLDNVLFGTKTTEQLNVMVPILGQQTLPPGAGSFYMSGPSTVGTNGAINVRRVWADILTPIGMFRIGRQPSNWGMGIFQNDGNELQGDFGDTADRILYLLQYELGGSGAITGGVLWDIAYEVQEDPRISGLAVAPESNNRDTQQYGGFVLYENTDMALGAFGGLRRRNGQDGATTMDVTDAAGNTVRAGDDGDTMMYFADLYAKYTWENYTFKFEGVYLGGKVTTGLALNGFPFTGIGAADPANPCGSGGIICLPRNQSMQVFMAAFEAEGKYKTGDEWKLRAGYAPGDGSPLSNKITQFGFRPDYQISLMMFHMPLGTTPALVDTNGVFVAGNQPVTGNYINNALYLSGGYKHKFDLKNTDWAEWVRVGGKVTTAWAPKKNTNINFADLLDPSGTGTAWPAVSETASSMWQRWYGLEMDISLEARLFKSLYTALEGGVLLPGRAYDVDVNIIDPSSIIAPIPKDKASLAWMIRLTGIIQF